jgi:hypothetical protein
MYITYDSFVPQSCVIVIITNNFETNSLIYTNFRMNIKLQS